MIRTRGVDEVTCVAAVCRWLVPASRCVPRRRFAPDQGATGDELAFTLGFAASR
jgi:hypothetical protein